MASTARVHRHYKSGLTDAGANNVWTLALAADSRIAGGMTWAVLAADAADQQATYGTCEWSAVNDAGAITVNINSNTLVTQASTGTLTVTWTATAGASLVTLAVTPNSSLVPTTLIVDCEITQHTQQGVTPL